tara:strand:+ start:586 stop:1023 length:438 start_codon:yes stop_codon:yes gene_type:complete
MSNTNKPWNYRMKMGPMPQEQKDKISQAHIGKNKGPRPHLWITGPDPILKRLRRRWLLAKNQATFWNQTWSIDWDQYKDLLLDHVEQIGRSAENINLCRVDKTQGWTVDNTQLIHRSESRNTPKARDSNGRVIRRYNTKQLKENK